MNIQKLNPLSGKFDYYKLLIPEEIGNILSGIFVDTDTINFEYDGVLNQMTAIVIDDSITNDKLAEMPPETVKANLGLTTANPQDVAISKIYRGVVEVIGGIATVFNSDINISSSAVYSIVVGSSVSSVPFQVETISGQIIFDNQQVGDNGFLNYIIII